jgi:lipoprotein-anchoring transpeptidase ErfK/SrfK
MPNKKKWMMAGGSVAVVVLVAAVAGVVITSQRSGSPEQVVSVETAPPVSARDSGAERTAKKLLEQAASVKAQGSLVEAKRLYQRVLQETELTETASAALDQLGRVNVEMFFSPNATPDSVYYRVQPGDTLSKIAREFSTTVDLLMASNQLKSDLIRIGQRLKVSRTDFNVVVDKSQNTLTLKNKDEVLKVYRCSTGEGGITPAGDFKIVSRMVDPVWKGVVEPGHPDNPLGTRWLGFDLPEYGIHGTKDPESIGLSVTRGCVRLTNSDVEELYALLPAGTHVTVTE